MAASKQSKKTPQPSAKKPAKSLAKPVVIDTSIKNDRSVEIRGNIEVNAATVYQLQRALLLQHIAKLSDKADTSSLKFYLGPCDAKRYRQQDQAALADTMVLVNRPVDVLVRSSIGPDMLKAFLSATGKRYLYAGATLQMGPVTGSVPYGKNKENQVRRQLFNDYLIDLQTLVMQKTGEKSRKKVYEDLLSAREISAAQALLYGKQGLIDGILMGRNEVITRVDLNQFIQEKGMSLAEADDFFKHYINVYKLPTRPLQQFSKASVPLGTLSFYVSVKAANKKSPDKEPEKAGDKEGDKAGKGDNKDKKEKAEPAKPQLPAFYFGEKKTDPLPLNLKAIKEKAAKRMMVEYLPTHHSGILEDDVIFFNDGFRDETAEQIGDALVALDHKKVSQKRKSHIKIIENSPGGSVWSGQELRSLIKSLQTPVDVIVQGMGASCGSWLLCSATGNRFATPNARIMFHEAANQIRNLTPHNHFNEIHDGLDQATLDYIAIVADATGRSFEEVLKDFDHDVWLNPVESLFYGSKGMVDGVLVSADTVVTRKDVETVLLETFNTRKALNTYVEAKLLEKRDPRLGMQWRPDKHHETDPFENPLITLAAVAKRFNTPLASVTAFKHSLPDALLKGETSRSIDYFNVVVDDANK